jgi:hypothetical protein
VTCTVLSPQESKASERQAAIDSIVERNPEAFK